MTSLVICDQRFCYEYFLYSIIARLLYTEAWLRPTLLVFILQVTKQAIHKQIDGNGFNDLNHSYFIFYNSNDLKVLHKFTFLYICTYSHILYYFKNYSPMLLSKLTIQSCSWTLFHSLISDQKKEVGLQIVRV